MTESRPLPIRMLRLRQVMEMTGLGKTTIYDKMKQGRFPQAWRLDGGKDTRWPEDEIVAWLEAARPKADQDGIGAAQPR